MKRTVIFELDGVSYTVEVERQGETLHLTHQGETFTVLLQSSAGASAAATGVAATETAVAAPPPAVARSGASAQATPAAPSSAGPGTVVAPMTGTIREVKVVPGDAVTEGQLLLVMEAMKMDIDIVAPATGAIEEVLVREGQSVLEAEILARIGGDVA